MKIENRQAVLSEIYDLRYIKGYSLRNVVVHLVKVYGITETYAYNLCAESRDEMAGHYYTEKRLEEQVAKMEELNQKALEEDNIKLSLEIQKELNKLLELGKDKELQALKEGVIINIVKPKEGE